MTEPEKQPEAQAEEQFEVVANIVIYKNVAKHEYAYILRKTGEKDFNSTRYHTFTQAFKSLKRVLGL